MPNTSLREAAPTATLLLYERLRQRLLYETLRERSVQVSTSQYKCPIPNAQCPNSDLYPKRTG
ncbi:MAG: hypothetical protein ACYTXA_05790 [Nostoc sp.]